MLYPNPEEFAWAGSIDEVRVWNRALTAAEEFLPDATPLTRSRYHRVLGDWLPAEIHESEKEGLQCDNVGRRDVIHHQTGEGN